VRLEPQRPALAASAITPDNAYFYIRQLADHKQLLETYVPPSPPATEPRAAEAPAGGSSADRLVAGPGTAAVPGQTLLDEETRLHSEGYSPGTYPLLEGWLSDLGPAFELCERAAGAAGSQVVTATSPDDNLDYLAPLKRAVQAYSYRIGKQACEGHWDGVVADARTAFAIGRSVSHGGCLINRLVTMACDAIVCSSLRQTAGRHPLPEEALSALLAMLAAEEGLADPMAETLRHELLVAQGGVDLVLGQGGEWAPGVGPIGPRATRALVCLGSGSETMKGHLADCFSLLIQDAEQPYRADGPGAQQVSRFCRDALHRLPWSLLRGDPLGRILASGLLAALDQARGMEMTSLATLRATALTLALHDWRREHGQPPARLDELVPAYFTALPADPCSGAAQAPFVYCVEGSEWRLYSVGPDQRDDGGEFDLRQRDRRRPGQEDVCFPSTEFALASAEGDGGHATPPDSTPRAEASTAVPASEATAAVGQAPA
jgi:hypothetical protein